MEDVPNRMKIERENFFLFRFFEHVNENLDEDERILSIKDMLEMSRLDGKCRKVLEQEDLDVICGAPDISGKDAAIQKQDKLQKIKRETDMKNKKKSNQIAPIDDEKNTSCEAHDNGGKDGGR